MKKWICLAVVIVILAAASVMVVTAHRNSDTIRRLSFRAEVIEFDPMFSARNEDGYIFVTSITPVCGDVRGGRYFVRINDSVVIRDARGNAISRADLLPGTIVNIRYYGIVLQSYPAIIPGTISIRVVE